MSADVEALTDLIREDRKPKPLCRDCADAAVHGRCDNDRSPCNPDERLAEAIAGSDWIANVKADAEELRRIRAELGALCDAENGSTNYPGMVPVGKVTAILGTPIPREVWDEEIRYSRSDP